MVWTALDECAGTGKRVSKWNDQTGEATCPVCSGRILLLDYRSGGRGLLVAPHTAAPHTEVS